MPITAADYIIQRLRQQGVEALFGVPAVYCAAMFAAAERAPQFRTIVASSDLEAGYAADGYARVRGLSVVSVAYGVGTLSLVNAIAGAYIERSSIVVINGGPSQRNIDEQKRTGVLFSHSTGKPHSDLDAFRPFTTFCERVANQSDIPALVDRALAAALKNKRPVYLEIPQAWLRADCPEPVGSLDLSVPPGSAENSAQMILDAVRAARAPLLVVGIEIQRYGLATRVLSIIDKLRLPWTTTLLAKSTLSERHPRFLGVFNGQKAPQALKDAIVGSDLIIALGAVFGSGHASLMIPKFEKTIRVWDGAITAFGTVGEPLSIVHLIEALDRNAFKLGADRAYPSEAYGDADKSEGDASVLEHGERAWDGDRDDTPDEFLELEAATPTPIPNGLTYDELYAVLAEPAFLDPSFIVIADTFLGVYPAATMKLPSRDSFICSAIWSSIGHSVGASVGAAIPGGKRPVAICGDGGFQMTAQALATMARMKQNVIVVIVDNGLYGYEQYLLGPSYYTNPNENPLPFATLSRWNYEGFAKAMGASFAAKADSVATLRALLAAAKMHHDGPAVIHALVQSRSLPAGL